MSTHKKPSTKFHIEWNKVTWYSKLAAVILFVAVLFIGIWLGMQYQYAIDQFNASEKMMPSDGWTGGAVPQRCGGFIKNTPTCPVNYHCVLGRIPDMGGTCVHD